MIITFSRKALLQPIAILQVPAKGPTDSRFFYMQKPLVDANQEKIRDVCKGVHEKSRSDYR
jgi:hypothetical protein